MIPRHLARRVLCDLMRSGSRGCTLRFGSKHGEKAAASWTDPKNAIPTALVDAVRTGQIRTDANWLMGADPIVVGLLEAAWEKWGFE